MAVDATATSWAMTQFGDRAGEVSRRVVRALSDAQEVGTRAQRASGLHQRYTYGSTWISKFHQLIDHLRELPGFEEVSVPRAPYKLAKVNGRLLIPFVLARSLSDIPPQPKLTSEVQRAIAAKTVALPPRDPTLFDHDDAPLPVTSPVPGPRTADDAEGSTADAPSAEEPPVFIGYVCNSESESLLAVWWGTAESIDDDGVMTWSPEKLPPWIAEPSQVPRPVPTPRSQDTVPGFDEGAIPPLSLSARSQPVEAPPELATPDTEGQRLDDAVAGDDGE